MLKRLLQKIKLFQSKKNIKKISYIFFIIFICDFSYKIFAAENIQTVNNVSEIKQNIQPNTNYSNNKKNTQKLSPRKSGESHNIKAIRERDAKLLGWESLPASQSLCRGKYKDPLLNLSPAEMVPADTTHVTADDASLIPSGESILEGNVFVEQPNRTARADRAVIQRDDKGDIQQIDLYGNVEIREPGHLYVGDTARIYRDHSGNFNNVLYRVALNKDPANQGAADNRTQWNELNAWGHAKKAKRNAQGIVRLQQSTYTTCAPTDNVWRVDTSQIDLNRDTGRGYAHNAVLKVKDVPIFYLPYFNFPIDDRRQSGWLFPTYGNSTLSGFMFTAPYYWNIAPNYDATITPKLFSKRGVGLEGLFRYLDKLGSGSIDGFYLPHDRALAKFKDEQAVKYPPGRRLNRLLNTGDNRYSVRVQDTRRFNDNWSSNIDFNQVSDDYFFQDFGHGVLNTTETALNRQATLLYSNENWNGGINVQNYQTLHPINQDSIGGSYNRMPQLTLNASYPDIYNIDYLLNTEYVYFDHPKNPDAGTIYVTGSRAHAIPAIQVPFNTEYGFLIPKIQLPVTYYALQNQTPGAPTNINRTIPMFSLDSGVYFDRQTTLWKKGYQQTLEPRVYYLYVPYKNQNEIPEFDTGLNTFDIGQVFRDNRFSGYDRIGDANQVGIGLTTRLIDEETGAEKFNAGIGQIYYFRDRQVTLCNTPGCHDSEGTIAAPSSTSFQSPLAIHAEYRLQDSWYAIWDGAWDRVSQNDINSNFRVHYQADAQHIMEVGYNYVHSTTDAQSVSRLKQGHFSFYWPLTQQWGTIGHWTYNFSDRRSQLAFLGLEYNSCCWAMRFVGERSFVALNDLTNKPEYENAVYLQLLLKGLGSIGTSNAADLLQTNVPGYYDFLKRA